LDGSNSDYVGPCVGAADQGLAPRAPYPNNYWFSFPGSCPQGSWKGIDDNGYQQKTEQCRKDNPGGLCPIGVQPDGVNCTFSYNIIGFIEIDELVGIKEMGYKSYADFCKDKNGKLRSRA